MRAFQVRLSDPDRKRYADGDEWLTFDPNIYDSMSWRELMVIERELSEGAGRTFSINLLRSVEIPASTALGTAATVWLARQQAGLTKPGFAEFTIDPLMVKARVPGSGAVPLPDASPTPGETDQTSSDTSAETEPPKRPSRSSRRS